MEYTFLVRGYASKDIWLWLMVLALIVLMLGGRWMITKLLRFIKKKKDSTLSTR